MTAKVLGHHPIYFLQGIYILSNSNRSTLTCHRAQTNKFAQIVGNPWQLLLRAVLLAHWTFRKLEISHLMMVHKLAHNEDKAQGQHPATNFSAACVCGIRSKSNKNVGFWVMGHRLFLVRGMGELEEICGFSLWPTKTQLDSLSAWGTLCVASACSWWWCYIDRVLSLISLSHCCRQFGDVWLMPCRLISQVWAAVLNPYCTLIKCLWVFVRLHVALPDCLPPFFALSRRLFSSISVSFCCNAFCLLSLSDRFYDLAHISPDCPHPAHILQGVKRQFVAHRDAQPGLQR